MGYLQVGRRDSAVVLPQRGGGCIPLRSGEYANHTAGAITEPALRSSRTYVHSRPVLVLPLPGSSTGTGVSFACSFPSVRT